MRLKFRLLGVRGPQTPDVEGGIGGIIRGALGGRIGTSPGPPLYSPFPRNGPPPALIAGATG